MVLCRRSAGGYETRPTCTKSSLALTYSLHLTEEGRATVKLIGEISDDQKNLLAAVPEEEQGNLRNLLRRIATQQAPTHGGSSWLRLAGKIR